MPPGISQLQLLTDQIKDPIIKDNFQRVQEEFRRTVINSANWQFYEIDVTGSVTDYAYQHRLGFRPKDVLITSTIGLGVLTFNYAAFTQQNIIFSTTGPVKFRCFLGTYFEDIGA